MRLDLERVRQNARDADTEDLLDRVTVYRAGMEPDALEVIEKELRARGVRAGQIEEHGARQEQEVILLPDGTAARCSFCRRPAVEERWGWHRLWGVVPLFPQPLRRCRDHR